MITAATVSQTLANVRNHINFLRSSMAGQEYTALATTLHQNKPPGITKVEAVPRANIGVIPMQDYVLNVTTLSEMKTQVNVFINLAERKLYVVE